MTMTTLAFVFPGQGSQTVGMLDAWGDHPSVRDTLAEASAALGEDLAALIAQGPKEQLDLTTNTQPVMLSASVAAWRAWRAEGGALPAAVAGHSLGEYSALVAAGVLSLADAVPLVRLRAQAMQAAVPVGTGGMAAILGLPAEKVVELCAELAATSGEVIEAANFNDPAQTVIAGSAAGIALACEKLKAAGAKRALPLAVSAPFHSSLIRPAAEALRERLAQTTLKAPQIPLIHNVDLSWAGTPDEIRDALVRQTYSAVRWVGTVQALAARGITQVVECGPGKVLQGLVKRIEPAMTTAGIADPASLADTRALLG